MTEPDFPYEAPAVVDLGTLEDLTQSNKQGGKEPGQPSNTKT